jgi:proline racemase
MDTFTRVARACGFEPRIVLGSASDSDRDQLLERLHWTPKQRLDYLLDMLAFEDRAHRARRVKKRR